MRYIWTEDTGAGLHYWELAAASQEQIVILDMICFEHIILSFSKLIEWTGTGKKDKIAMREVILSAVKDHKIDIDNITDQKTSAYLMGFDCCVNQDTRKKRCGMNDGMTGECKIKELLADMETQRIKAVL